MSGYVYEGTEGNDYEHVQSIMNDTLYGRGGNDTLIASDGKSLVYGGTGNDFLYGERENDTIFGEDGNDQISGGDKNDLLYGGIGNDAVSGGAQVVSGGAQNDTVYGGEGNDSVVGGQEGNDLVYGEDGNDRAGSSSRGNNTVYGGNGNDTIEGGNGNYQLYPGESDNDVLYGGEGNDYFSVYWNYGLINSGVVFNGDSGKDTVMGSPGNDTINGGADQDVLLSRGGKDVFVFAFGESLVRGQDRLGDFAIGTDKIDLLTNSGNSQPIPKSLSRAADTTASDLFVLAKKVFADSNGALSGNQPLGVHSAAIAVVTSGLVGTYLIINDWGQGFNSQRDLIINITGYSGTLPALGTTTPSTLFV